MAEHTANDEAAESWEDVESLPMERMLLSAAGSQLPIQNQGCAADFSSRVI